MVMADHEWTDEKKNFRKMLSDDADVVEIVWCRVHKEYELLINAHVYRFPMDLKIEFVDEK